MLKKYIILKILQSFFETTKKSNRDLLIFNPSLSVFNYPTSSNIVFFNSYFVDMPATAMPLRRLVEKSKIVPSSTEAVSEK